MLHQMRADDRPRTGYLLQGKQVRVHMRFIRVHGFAAVPGWWSDGLFAYPHRDLNPGDRTENPAGCHYLMGASSTVDGDRTRAARIESPDWQPAATTALRAPYGT